VYVKLRQAAYPDLARFGERLFLFHEVYIYIYIYIYIYSNAKPASKASTIMVDIFCVLWVAYFYSATSP
jgi:hypothetical protein